MTDINRITDIETEDLAGDLTDEALDRATEFFCCNLSLN